MSDDDPWSTVPGQPAAIRLLQGAVAAPVHAYLFVGPEGHGSRAAARVFAGEILATGAHDAPERDRHRRLAATEQHPDLVVVEPEGNTVRRDEARRLVEEAYRTPTEGPRKVLLGSGFEAPEPEAMALLLKTVEEPPPGRVFVLLADDVPPELTTIVSRCVRVEFPALPTATVTAALTGAGLDPERAAEVAAVAHGDLSRARLLASDDRLALRLAAWRAVPERLDETGATVARLVDELRTAIDAAAVPLTERQRTEAAAVQERAERYGQRGSGARDLETRHRRAMRRLRTDELRMGLAELARRYRDELAVTADPEPVLQSLRAVHLCADALVRNPNEELALQALLLRLAPLR
ncbi:MAG: hypothetical protein HYX34_14140 [Actinobacteria bacterium]|nr:hypothetical protein [Actinomycetota bacterium]